MEGSVDRANVVDADEAEGLTLLSTAPPPTDDMLQPEADAHPKAIEAQLKEEKKPLEEEKEPLEEEKKPLEEEKEPLEGEKKPLDEEQLNSNDESRVEAESPADLTVRTRLPLAHVERLMKIATRSNPRMIGPDAAPAVAFLGECFLKSLTRQARRCAAAQERDTVEYEDILNAISSSHQCDFLGDVVHDSNKKRMRQHDR